MTEEGAHLMVIGKQRMREEKAGVPMSPRRVQLKTFLLVRVASSPQSAIPVTKLFSRRF